MKPTALAPFFLSAFAWSVTLGMSHILVPLYAYELGYSALAIGGILSAPVLVHFAFTLIAGAFTDRFGGRRMALASYTACVLAGILFALSQSYAALLAGQTCLVISRAIFWPAIWGLAMQLPGDRGGQTGRLNSVTNVAQIVGTAAAGLLVTAAGFRYGFWALAGAGLCALAAMLAFAHGAPQAQAPRGIFAAYAAIARRRSTYYAILCAFMAGLPLSLSMSFYPILLVEHGHASDATGWLIALRAAGAALVGAWAGRYLRGIGGARVPVAAGIAIGACIAAVAFVAQALPVGLFMVGVGIGSGVMTVYFQLSVAEASTPAERGSALALSGLGWQISHFVTPLTMGALAELFGIGIAVAVFGALALALAAALWPLHAWALRGARV
ncbi:MAG: MFS transporter [Burkholderiales bacterium]|nr:MFS transporter [Burkholderiales bacterium]